MTTAVEKVNGVGLRTAKYLKTKRVITAEALIKFGVEKLALAPGIGLERAEAAIKEAKKLVGASAASSSRIEASAARSSRIEKKKPSARPKSKLVGKDKKEKKGKKEKKKNKKDKKNKKNKKDKKKSK